MKLLALSNEGPCIYNLDCSNTANENEKLVKEDDFPKFSGADIAKFSPINGKLVAVVDAKGIHLVDVSTKKISVFIERTGISALEWSPQGTYVISCERIRAGVKNNLIVWNASTGEKVAEFEWKNTAKDGPKSVKFNKEEKFCARQIGKNIIEIYDATNLGEPKFTIKSKLPPLPKIDG